MPKRFWLFIIGTIITIVSLPLVLDWLIIGNSFPSNIANSDWVSFFGGYIGAIVGAIVSLVGIVATIRFTKAQIDASHSQFEEQKRLNYIPILDLQISRIMDSIDSDTITMNCEYTINPTVKLHPFTLTFDICNIGIGAASDLCYGMIIDKVSQDGVFWLPHKRVIRAQATMEQKITLYIPHNEDFTPTLTIFYDDVLGNRYCKSVSLVFKYIRDSEQVQCVIMNQDKGILSPKAKEKLYYVVAPKNHSDKLSKTRVSVSKKKMG